jgi:hypothetical protein
MISGIVNTPFTPVGEAGLLETILADTTDAGKYIARRATACGRRDLEELRESVAHCVTRKPLLAVGAIFAAGMLTAVLSGQCARVLRTRSARQT